MQAAKEGFWAGGALGDAGVITTDDRHLEETLRKLINYGSSRKYFNSIRGYNCRLDEMQAALVRVKLKYLDQDNAIRRQAADFYLKNINKVLLGIDILYCPLY